MADYVFNQSRHPNISGHSGEMYSFPNGAILGPYRENEGKISYAARGIRGESRLMPRRKMASPRPPLSRKQRTKLRNPYPRLSPE